MENLHSIQMQILRELIFHPNSKFSDLNISGLTNDHFSYHIKTLILLGFVSKNENRYSLTNDGKIFASKIDTDNNKTEKQPKLSVFIRPMITIKKQTLFAVQQRLKEPYYGYFGFITGKIKWGEKVEDAAKRELFEEMNLVGEIVLSNIVHEMVYDKNGKMLEDKFFHCASALVSLDTLEKEKEGCRNQWMTEQEFLNITPKFHSEVEIFNWFKNKTSRFIEKSYIVDGF